MNEQYIKEDIFYLMLYAAMAMLSLTACCYLLFRRANAIAPDVTSPVRLRRWTAAFFAAMTLSHVWYLPVAFHTSSDDILMSYLVGAVLDFTTLIPLAVITLLVMLQDRRRPLWPVFAMVVPPIAILAACIASRSDALLPQLYVYYLLLAIGLIIYMVHATRQYGHWLHDNYADLEHKEVWQSLVVLAIILMVFGVYSFASYSMIYKYIAQANNMILICYLLWRVETLSDMSDASQRSEICRGSESAGEQRYENSSEGQNPSQVISRSPLPLPPRTCADNIGPLLKQHCEEPQLYLQYDINVTQLANLIGTNRAYLSKYFALQSTTYNAYINGLRIQHFIHLYHQAVATRQPVLAKQLAYQSGFHSYSTFSAAFKQVMGMTAKEWMHGMTE